MRVLFFNYSNAPGGAEQSLLGLFSALDPGRVTPSLLTFGEGPLSERARALGVRVHSLAGTPELSGFGRERLFLTVFRFIHRLPGLLRTLFAIRRLVQTGGFDILHTNNPKSHVMGALATTGLRVRLVFHMRDIFPENSSARHLLSILGRLRKVRTLAISRAVLTALPPGLSARARLLYNGLPLPGAVRPAEAVRAELGFPKEGLLILSAGRLVPWKGFDLLLRAAAPLLVTRNARLCIAGEAWYGENDLRPGLRALAGSLSIADRVTLPGHVEDIGSLMAASDLFVLPSENEPFGRALVEAMLAGVPVAAFNRGGPAELVQNGITGWLVDERSETALREALDRLLCDTVLRRTLGEQGREAARMKFTLDRTVAGLHGFYDELESGRA